MISQDHVIKGQESHTPANVGGHSDRGNRDIMVLVFDMMTSPTPAWLVSFESTPLHVPAC